MIGTTKGESASINKIPSPALLVHRGWVSLPSSIIPIVPLSISPFSKKEESKPHERAATTRLSRSPLAIE
jgi:hypothetical protein